jgi:hypothetical protein
MKLSIVIEDSAVSKDGEGMSGLMLDGVPPSIRALQWDGQSGHLEELDGTNVLISALPQWALDAEQSLITAQANQPVDNSPLIAEDKLAMENVLLAYPKASQSSVDALVNSGLPNIQVVPYIREADNTLIGVFSGYMVGAEGVASFHTLTQMQAKLGCPIFAQPAPKDPAMLPQFVAMIEDEGYTVIGQETKYSFPAWTLVMAKSAAKISRSIEIFNEAEEAGFLWGEMLFDVDTTARANIAAKAVQLVLDPSISQIGWRLKTNVAVIISSEDFKQIALDLIAHMENVYQESWALKAQIDSATTIAEVDAL